MRFLIILIALAHEFFFDKFLHLRRYDWYHKLSLNLANRLKSLPAWNSALGVFILLAAPIGIWLVYAYISGIASIMELLLGLVILIYCLGLQPLSKQTQALMSALNSNNQDEAATAAKTLADSDTVIAPSERGKTVVSSTLQNANNRIFGVIFWFFILGPLGALVFRFLSELRGYARKEDLGCNDEIAGIYGIFDWIPARLAAFGYALCGSFEHTFAAWNPKATMSFQDSEKVAEQSGLGSLLLTNNGGGNELGILNSTWGLLKRTLIFLLILLGILTVVLHFNIS